MGSAGRKWMRSIKGGEVMTALRHIIGFGVGHIAL